MEFAGVPEESEHSKQEEEFIVDSANDELEDVEASPEEQEGLSDREFVAAVAGYYTTAKSVAGRVIHNVHDAEDAVQDALLRAWNARGKFRGDSETSTWLHRIVHNTSLTNITRIVRKRVDSTDEMQESGIQLRDDEEENGYLNPELAAEHAELLQEIMHHAHSTLSPSLFEVFIRRASGTGYAEIAEELGISENAAKVRMNRARKRLDAALDWQDRLDDSQDEQPDQ